VKLLTLMEQHIGEQFLGVVTAITKFGLFIQLDKWLVEGLIKYPQLMNDYWEVDERGGVIRGRNSGQRIHIGDVAEVEIARVDIPRRELDLHVLRMRTRGTKGAPLTKGKGKKRDEAGEKVVSAAMQDKKNARSGGERRSAKSKSIDKKKGAGPRREKRK
jgi:ribonuclease R